MSSSKTSMILNNLKASHVVIKQPNADLLTQPVKSNKIDGFKS